MPPKLNLRLNVLASTHDPLPGSDKAPLQQQVGAAGARRGAAPLHPCGSRSTWRLLHGERRRSGCRTAPRPAPPAVHRSGPRRHAQDLQVAPGVRVQRRGHDSGGGHAPRARRQFLASGRRRGRGGDAAVQGTCAGRRRGNPAEAGAGLDALRRRPSPRALGCLPPADHLRAAPAPRRGQALPLPGAADCGARRQGHPHRGPGRERAGTEGLPAARVALRGGQEDQRAGAREAAPAHERHQGGRGEGGQR